MRSESEKASETKACFHKYPNSNLLLSLIYLNGLGKKMDRCLMYKSKRISMSPLKTEKLTAGKNFDNFVNQCCLVLAINGMHSKK